MSRVADALAHARRGSGRFVEELKEFIGFPSVSAQPEHAGDLRRCAGWLVAHLRRIGLRNARIIATPRHPIVYADWLGAPGRPTVMIYGHYDVQPADPLDEWLSPPFVAEVRGNDIHGRGACDDKGQMLAHLKSIESWMAVSGGLPVNVRCLFEGEEEIGSEGLRGLLREHAGSLRSDMVLISDMPMPAPDRPAITYGMRGALSLELEVRGPARDLHSGIFGGAVHDPLQALCELIASLHDRDGRIAIPGFYDDVIAWDGAEREYMRSVGPSDAAILRDAGAGRGWGEPGFTLYERTTIRPALTINGLDGGYRGAGGKGVIPSRASAKLSLRLAPGQDPWRAERLVRAWIAEMTPPTVTTTLRAYAHARPAVIDRGDPALGIAARACTGVFGRPPVFLRSGGTIPVVDTFMRSLGAPVVLMGFALPGDRMHGPNEKFHLPNFHNGIATSIRLLAEAGSRIGPRRCSSLSCREVASPHSIPPTFPNPGIPNPTTGAYR